MKKTILLITAIIFSVNCFSQPTIQWQKCLGGSANEVAYSIEQTFDGGYIVAGAANSNDGDVAGNHSTMPNNDYWVVKLNSTGSIQWQKCFGGSGDDQAHSIQQTADSGYVVAGYSNSNDSDVTGNHGGYDYWVVKLTASGNLQWQKCLGGSAEDRAYSVQQTADGGYIIAGKSFSNNGDVSGNNGSNDCWIVKLSAAGNIQWQNDLGGSSYDEAQSVQQTTDNGYIVAGFTFSNDSDVTGNHGGYDYWVMKLSGIGSLQWKQCYGGSANDMAYSVQQTVDGGYIVGGYTYSNDGDVTGNHSVNTDYWAVKLSDTGNIQWQKCLGGNNQDYATSIKQTTDGGYIMAGGTYSFDGDITTCNPGLRDEWVVKLSGTGTLQWQKCMGGTYADDATSVQQTTDGGYMVAGLTASNNGDVSGNHSTNSDYWLVKLNSYVSIEENSTVAFDLSPNPATSELTIENPELKIKEIEIYNAVGKEVFSQPVTSNAKQVTISITDFPPGIYFIAVTDQGGNKVTKKVVKM
jgi:Secretion system C-terminal sorting domain